MSGWQFAAAGRLPTRLVAVFGCCCCRHGVGGCGVGAVGFVVEGRAVGGGRGRR